MSPVYQQIYLKNGKTHTIGQFTQHCIVYAVLNILGCLERYANSMLYCVIHIPNVVFWHSNNLLARNQTTFKNI